MIDETEAYRRAEVARINAAVAQRKELEQQHGQVFDTAELTEHFDVIGFAAPYVIVQRKADGVRGTLEFQHNPRFYYGFVAD
jgi:hypothetical protein